MVKWLTIGAAVTLLWTSAASAQLKNLGRIEIAHAGRAHALDLRLSPQMGIEQAAPFGGENLARRDIAPNATVGLGFANGRAKVGGEFRVGGGPGRPRKPVVTFTIRF
jgi:hypothetical protein